MKSKSKTMAKAIKRLNKVRRKQGLKKFKLVSLKLVKLGEPADFVGYIRKDWMYVCKQPVWTTGEKK